MAACRPRGTDGARARHPGALTHANIARLYEAGITAGGRPYLALEYVEGSTIDAYCAGQRLDVHARVRLFLQVVEAVAYAHARLVVHRDLKPSNILVTKEGQVRLLDFGIARLLEEGSVRDTPLTELSGRPHTPEYASPEQIAGGPLGIATDIYSLGVVLYELLCGRGRTSFDAIRSGRLKPPCSNKIPIRQARLRPNGRCARCCVAISTPLC